ncbi:MAG: alpha-L-rhamnosidase N-terminal domain-containing protein, partial [Melioribacteraceae bacterium]|nr:alpha-L-rhamnosidase N-terminal domain-containing protein [Melioribacteraceae bacterium]
MSFKKHLIYFAMIFAFIFGACQNEDIIIKVVSQSCENRIDPLGIDVLNPHLGWKLVSTHRSKKQSAYQIIVSDSKEALSNENGNLWDTEKINSNQSIQIKYKGKELSSELIYYWKVRVWDEDGNVSDWSNTAQWEMGLLEQSDWEAKWINDGKSGPQSLEEFYKNDPAPYFRRDFKVDKRILKARLYITGLGYYEATINGKRVGDYVLDPGWTNYSKRVQYSTYDVTDLIESGGNSFSVELGNGWYNLLPMTMWGSRNIREHLTSGRPQFIAQLKIKYTDGSSQIVVSNEEWKTHEGPILRNNIYLGEIYDARKEIAGWNTFGFDDSKWDNVKISRDKLGKLQAQNQPPIKITAKLNPIKLSEPKPNVYIFDMGQ